MNRIVLSTFALLALCTPAAVAAETHAVELAVDASTLDQRILHSRVVVEAKPGPLTLYYPKWVPGTHGPTTPLADLAGFRIRADGKDIAWSRDDVDLYAVHLVVPTGIKALEVTFDILLPGLSDPPSRQNTVASAKVAVLNLCDLLVYPKTADAQSIPFHLALKLPGGWKLGTALTTQKEDAGTTSFAITTLETLIDSPILCGAHTKEIPIGPAGGKHRVFLACDSEAGLDVAPETKKAWDQLIAEAAALFGSRPYGSYTFLLALTDKFRYRGLEHHESSDNRLPELTLVTPNLRLATASLFPHEYVHAWCGKFRRPAVMIVPDFQQAPKTKLLWVYEGLTNYLGWVLTTRSGLSAPEDGRNQLAVVAERMRNSRGREWRPLEDTAAASHLLVDARGSWAAWRRSLDYYDEGTLIWLEADVIIRRETKGTKSLDDFCKAFFACPPGRPKVKGYTLDDIATTLNTVAPYDWKGHFTRRVTLSAAEAPLDGLTLGGWTLGYAEKPTESIKAAEGIAKSIDLTSSIGAKLSAEGTVLDVIPEGPAVKAGLAPGMKLVAINGRRFTPDLLRSSVAATKNAGKLDLLMENGDFFKAYSVAYTGGARYPKLERYTSEADLINEITKSTTKKGE